MQCVFLCVSVPPETSVLSGSGVCPGPSSVRCSASRAAAPGEPDERCVTEEHTHTRAHPHTHRHSYRAYSINKITLVLIYMLSFRIFKNRHTLLKYTGTQTIKGSLKWKEAKCSSETVTGIESVLKDVSRFQHYFNTFYEVFFLCCAKRTVNETCSILYFTFASVFFWPLWEHLRRIRMRTELSLPPPHSQLVRRKYSL